MKLSTIGVGLSTAILVSIFVYAQPVGPVGISRVSHDGTLTGNGTTASPLSVTSPNTIRALVFGPAIVPAALPSGNTNDWNPTGAGVVVDTDTGTLSTTTRIGVQTNIAGSTITGVTAQVNGRILILENLGDGIQSATSTLTLTHQDSNSSSANQWFIPGLRSCVLPVGGVAMAIYFTGHPHWFLISCYTNGSFQQVDTPQLNATVGSITTSTTQDDTLTGALSPSALPSGSTDNWTFTGLSSSTEIHVTTNGAGSTLKGLVAQGNGKIRRLCNYGIGDLFLEHRTSSTSANQFWMPESSTFTVKSLGCVTLRDDTSLPGWVVTDADRSSTGILTSGTNITSSTSGVVAKWCGVNILCNSLLTENGTSFIVGTNVLTVTESNGNTDVAGTFQAHGVETLNASMNANNNKITNLTNGSSAQDAAAFGQVTALGIGSVTNLFVPKSNGAGALVNTSISDTGSAVQITEATSIQNTLFVQDFRGTEISPAGITGATNDWAPTGLSTATTILVASSSGQILLNGLTGGVTGRRIRIVNNDVTQSLVIRYENVGSIAANRFHTQYGDDITLLAGLGQSVECEYHDSRWYVVASTNYVFPILGDSQISTNRLPKSNGSRFADSLWADDGSTTTYNSTAFSVTTVGNTVALGYGDFKAGVYGGNGSTTDTVYITQDRLGFAYNSNGASTGHINSVGYLEGTTQFRNLEIDDGKNTAIAFFGQSASAPAASILNVDQTLSDADIRANKVELGRDTASAVSFRNGPTGDNLYGGQHLEWTDDFLYGISGSITTGSNLGFWKLIQAGTGVTLAQSLGVAGRPGIISFDTGSGTAGNDVLLTTGESIEFADGNYTFEVALEWPTLSSSSSSSASMYASEVGFADTAAINQQDGCYFAYDKGNNLAGSINAGNVDTLECYCANNNTRTGYLINNTGNSDEAFALGVGTIVAGTWYRLKVVVTGTTRAEFFRNNIKVCDINTNLPSTSLRQTAVQIGHYPLATTATGSRLLLVDQATLKVDFTSVRSP